MSSGYPDYTLPVHIIGVTIASIPVDIIAQTVGSIAIDIAAQTIGNVAISAEGATIMMPTDLQGATIMMPIDIQAQYIDLDINIKSQTADVDVNLNASAITLNVNLQSSSITLDVNIESQDANIDVNIAASAATLDIDVVAQSVDFNIKTSAANNIIVDLLTNTAYTERRATLENLGVSALYATFSGGYRFAKFFPRGCRGFIQKLQFYMKNASAGSCTLYINVSPKPGMMPVVATSMSAPTSTTAAWYEKDINAHWDFDSMFIYVQCDCASSPSMGYDTGTPYDGYISYDSGFSWSLQNRRYWMKAVMAGMTVGDVPISGTVNTIGIPNSGAAAVSGASYVQNDTETTVFTLNDTGIMRRLAIYTDHDQIEIKLEIDGTAINWATWTAWTKLTAQRLNQYGYIASTPDITLHHYNSAGDCMFAITLDIPFKRRFLIKAHHTTGSQQLVQIGMFYEKITT